MSRPFRLVQVSDTHLSRHKAHFQGNWERFLDLMRADPPDMVVVTGDLCFDAIEFPDDVAFARAQMDRIPCAWRAIPGNHDIGDQWPDTKFKAPVDDAKVTLWRDSFGADYWAEDRAGWRLVGLNGLLFESPLAAEQAQWDWLEAMLAGRGALDAMIFVHKPLFLDDPAGDAQTTMCYGPVTRARLLELARRHKVKVIACGHMHRHWAGMHQGVELVWAPSCGFVIGGFPAGIATGALEVGYVEWQLAPGHAAHRVMVPDSFEPADLAETMARLKSTVHMPLKPWAGS